MKVPRDMIETLLAYLHGELDSAETVSLEKALQESSELRRQLLELSVEECGLAEWANSEHVADELLAETGEASMPSSKPNPWLLLGGLASAAVIAIALSWNGTRKPPALPAIAQLVAATDAEWSRDDPHVNSLLFAGIYHLNGGSVDLLFTDGAKVSVSAPSRFELKNGRHIHLFTGSLVAEIPDEALGFIVTSPQSEVVDLGTEFGLSVTENGRTDVHVLDGLVEVLADDSSSVQIEAGEAFRFEQAPDKHPSKIAVAPREDILGRQSPSRLGAEILRGSIRMVESLSKSDITNTKGDVNQIQFLTEKQNVELTAALPVTIGKPGSFRRFDGNEATLPPGARLSSYLLHFRPSSKEPVSGVIRFSQPIMGILCNGEHLSESDARFGTPTVFYPTKKNLYRGLEPFDGVRPRSSTRAGWLPDEIILSQDRRTMSIRAFANTEQGYDQVRVLVLAED